LKREVSELCVLRMDNSEYLRNLMESMPRRMEEVVSNGGQVAFKK
jgi:hypothetical protein